MTTDPYIAARRSLAEASLGLRPPIEGAELGPLFGPDFRLAPTDRTIVLKAPIDPNVACPPGGRRRHAVDVPAEHHHVSFFDRHYLARRKGSRRWDQDLATSLAGETAQILLKSHESLVKELRLAEQVQRSMLPRVLPQLEAVTFGAALRPSLHLSGDFYNVMRLDRNHVGFYLGDVMGHGPAAALLGVFAMQGLRTKSIEGSSYKLLPPADVLQNLSQDLIRAEFPESPFVTMVYCVLETTHLELTYACGGHPPALLLRRDEPTAKLEGIGPLLGVFEAPIDQQSVPLRSGDRVALYSDGAESVRWGQNGDGVDGLARCLACRDGRSPQQLVDDTMAEAIMDEAQSDDLTLMLLEVS